MSYLRFLAAHPRFLAFGFALTFFSSFGQTFFIALFSEHIREDFQLTHGQFGFYYSLATVMSGLAIIWLGRQLDTVDLRLFSGVLCGGLVLACFGMAFAPVVILLAIAIFMLRLTGQGLLSHTAMTSMARYFEAERGKAMSIAGFGFPAGEATLPVLAVLVMRHIGWRETWLSLGLVLAVVIIPLVLWLLRGHSERHRSHLARIADDEADRHSPLAGQPRILRRQWTRGEVLRDQRFYVLLTATSAPGFIVTGFFFHQVHLVETKGWELAWFAACFAAFAAAQLPAGLAAGPWVDRVGATRLLPLYLLPLALSLVVLASGRHPVIAPIFMILAGTTSGLAGPVVGSMWAEVYGVRHLGAIRAVVTAVLVFSTAGSPVTIGWLIDAGWSMETIAWLCFGYTVLCAFLATIGSRRSS